MYGAFFLVAIIGMIYFSLKRGFDYFSLAYFSAVLYFLPGFFGYTSYHVNGVWRKLEIVNEAYAVMILVLSSIVIFSLIFRAHYSPVVADRTPPIRRIFILIVFSLACVGLIGTLLSLGKTLFVPDKALIMDGLGRWHILYVAAITIGFPAAYLLGSRFYCAIFLMMLFFEVYIGFRSPIAVSVLSVFTLYLTRAHPVERLIGQWKVAGLAVLFGAFLFSVKQVLTVFKAGSVDIVVDRLSSLSFYYGAVVKSEPFIVQSTLNHVISERFHTEWDHILSALNQFFLFSDFLGIDPRSFNSYFQNALFPDVTYGMASNIWAQMWSVGGWWLLVLFVVLFNLGIYFFNKTLACRNAILRASLAPMACYWVFYIHRNDISYIINLEKRLFIVFAIALFFSLLVLVVTREKPRRIDPANTVVSR